MARNTPGERKAIAAAERYLAGLSSAYEATIAKLYGGKLPDWVPEPAVARVRQAISSLRAAKQTDERIFEVVRLERDGLLQIPAVLDPLNFYDSANYLAHVQWALSLSKADAIRELGGRRAAQVYQRSKLGNDELYGTEAERQSRDQDICSRAQTMLNRNSNLTINAVAKQLAPAANLSERHLKRILRAGKVSKK
jgi:hypothetical protein